jgi:hypothetical protein
MTTAKVTGPLFSLGAVITATYLEEACTDLAKKGVEKWLYYLDRRLQHPTGYYTSNIHSEQTGIYNSKLNDNGVVYGPWLEGISSRNQSTSFEGYHSLQDTLRWLESQGGENSNELFVSRYLEKLQ